MSHFGRNDPSEPGDPRSEIERLLSPREKHPYSTYATSDLWLVLLHHTGFMNRTLLKLASVQPVEDKEMGDLTKHSGRCLEVILELQRRDIL